MDVKENGNIFEEMNMTCECERVHRTSCPWKRYFARMIDFELYAFVFRLIAVIVFHSSSTIFDTNHLSNIFVTIMALLMMFLIEPVLLNKFGTTLGKKVWGLYVEDTEGNRLSYMSALQRTGLVLFWGFGLYIPLYSLYRLWKSYKTCSDKELLEWDDKTSAVLKVKDEQKWRIVVYIIVLISIMGMNVGSLFYFQNKPIHTGEITVSEFADNYNHFLENFDIEPQSRLDQNGKWNRIDLNNGNDIVLEIGNQGPLNFKYIEEDGVMVGLEADRLIYNEGYIDNDVVEIVLSMLAFSTGKDDYKNTEKIWKRYVSEIQENPFQSFEFTAGDITVCYEVSYKGYIDVDGFLIALEDETELEYCLHFSMK